MKPVERILELIKEKGITNKEFLQDLGLSKNAISEWRSGVTKSYLRYIDKIAAYFGVSTDYILGKTEERRPAESVAAITDDDLPPEALKELETYKEFLRQKYKK